VHDLLRRQALFFGGKGGVGKTTCASATALAASRAGRRVLLVSTDPAHSTSDIFGCPFASTARQILPFLSGLEIDPVAEARRYIADVKRRAAALFRGPGSARALEQIDVAATMPGIEDAALFDRVAELVATPPATYDLMVVDTAPTGHMLQLIRTPLAISGWLRALADTRRHVLPEDRVESDEILNSLESRIDRLQVVRARLTSANVTAFVLVLTPERLPIDETLRAAAQLRDIGVKVGAVVVNRVLPADATGEFVEARRRQQLVHLQEIDRRFRGEALVHVTERRADIHGIADLEAIAAMLFT
jgi:arsenite/tail-anchored protein-transporting ATPase